MASKQSGIIIYDGIKAINPYDFDSNVGWTILSGEDQPEGIDRYFQRVPWLYRGVVDRANNVRNMPFSITRGEDEIDSSADYQNALERAGGKPGILPNPKRLFGQIEMSLTMTGRAYVFLETNNSGYVRSMKYCNPNSITEILDPVTGELINYERQTGTTSKRWPLTQFIAFSDPDYMTEQGAPRSSAAIAALTAAGVLFNADRFISEYFRRGAIKATILQMDGGSAQEADRLQNWWEKVITGVKNAWAAFVLRAKAIVPVVIGEGLEGLQNNELTTERRQDIATALGIPESRLWSAAANYATAKGDTQNYYKSTIIPECDLIAACFNEQLFTKEHKLDGYHLEFQSESLEIFQADQGEQATAAKAFVDFLTAAPTAEIAKETAAEFGFELSDAMITAIDAMFAKKDENAAQMRERMQPKPDQPNATMPEGDQAQEDTADQEDQQQELTPQEMTAARASWRRKAINAIKRGDNPNVEFTTSALPRRMCDAIHYELETAKTADDVRAIFEANPLPDPMAELKRANDLLEKVMNVPA